MWCFEKMSREPPFIVHEFELFASIHVIARQIVERPTVASLSGKIESLHDHI